MSKLQKAKSQLGHSRHFFELVRSIGESKSKQEEDRIILKEVQELKVAMAEKKVDNKTMKECVMRLIYCEMLGHTADFGYIHAVNLASSVDLIQKKVGYLGTWLLVSPEHEFMYLIVANIQRDLKSASFLEVSAALNASCKLIKHELMPSINTEITNLLKHQNALVRKKVVACMLAFYRRSGGAIGDEKLFRKALCDEDPSVMGAALSLYGDIIAANPEEQRDLFPSLLEILRQITEHRLAREFDYHRVPAPWMQIKLLRLISLLAAGDPQLSQRAADVVAEVIKRADLNINIGHAVTFEAVNAITTMVPIGELIEAAAEAIGKFITSATPNLKYLGITSLAKIVRIDPKYAAEHQHVVIDCLEDSDESIRRKTLDLLYAMANEHNIEAIVARLLRFLSETNDQYLRADLVKNLCRISEEFSPGCQWYVETLNKIIELAPENVDQTTVQGLLKLIAEGEGEDEEEDADFRAQCVEDYYAMVENPDKELPNALCQVIAWVIGEYGFLTHKVSREMIVDRLCDLLERENIDPQGREWMIGALSKTVAHMPTIPPAAEEIVTRFLDSSSVTLQQRAFEFLALTKHPKLMKFVLPIDGCCEDIQVDDNLTFLDGLVQEALDNGAKPYQRKDLHLGAEEDAGLKTEAYKTQQVTVVDEVELDKENFEKEDATLNVRERRWGANNLAEEEAVEKHTLDVASDDERPTDPSVPVVHVDPEIVAPAKKTVNDKFMAKLFEGGGSGGGGKKGGGRKRTAKGRTALAKKLAAEAEEATKDLPKGTRLLRRGHAAVDDDMPEDEPIVPTGGTPVPAPSVGSSDVEVQTQIQKKVDLAGLHLRVGVLCAAPLNDVSFVFTPQKNAAISSVTHPTTNEKSKSNRLTVDAVPPNAPCFVEVSLAYQNFPAGGTFVADVEHHGPHPGSSKAELSIGMKDTIAGDPQMTTQLFGQNWGKMAGGEFKCTITFSQPPNPEKYKAFLLETAGIRVVEIIKNEVIAAGKIVGTPQLVLVHSVVLGANVNVSVRTGSKAFSEELANHLASNTV